MTKKEILKNSFTVYITKYALTKGIFETRCKKLSNTMIRVGTNTYYHSVIMKLDFIFRLCKIKGSNYE